MRTCLGSVIGMGTKSEVTCMVHACMLQPPECSVEHGNCGSPFTAQCFFFLFDAVLMVTVSNRNRHCGDVLITKACYNYDSTFAADH